MKKLLTVAAILLSIFMVGCSKEEKPSNWYPIEGGYLNLNNVSRITTKVKIWEDMIVVAYGAGYTSEEAYEALKRLAEGKGKPGDEKFEHELSTRHEEKETFVISESDIEKAKKVISKLLKEARTANYSDIGVEGYICFDNVQVEIGSESVRFPKNASKLNDALDDMLKKMENFSRRIQ